MASQAFDNSEDLDVGNHTAVGGSNNGRLPHPLMVMADGNYREINVDNLTEADFEGMRDSGLSYSDHDYMGHNPTLRCPPETSQFPVMGGISDQYVNGETNEPCAERPDSRTSIAPMTAPSSVVRKTQVAGATPFRPVKGSDLAPPPASLFPAPGKSVSWKNVPNVTQQKKAGRPPKNEARELSGDRLMGRAMVKAGMQSQHGHSHQIAQGVHGMQDLSIHGTAPLVTPARGQKIMPRGRSAAGQRRVPDEGNGGFGMVPLQHPPTPFRSLSTSSPKKPPFRSAEAAEDAHTREMLEAAQNALAPTNATISGHNVMMNAHIPHHSIVLPVQHHQQQPSHHADDGVLPRTPGKSYSYTPITTPRSADLRRSISESQEMNIHLLEEPLRTNSDGLPVTPGGNQKTRIRSMTPRSRMSTSESTCSFPQAISPNRQYIISPTRHPVVQSHSFPSPQRQMSTALKSPPTGPVLSLSQGPSTMASAQMQMSSNAPMPSLHNQTYHQPPLPVTPRHTDTSLSGRPFYDEPGILAAPLITGSGSNSYTPRRRKEKESDEAVEAEVSRNVKNILQAEKAHHLSTTSSHTLSPRNETSDDDSTVRARLLVSGRERKRSTSTRTSHKQSKRITKQMNKEESEEDDWVVSCICGETEDDGEAMVACDQCKFRWEHVACIFPRTKKVPDGSYVCHTCAPRQTELTPKQAKDYQDRVKREKEMQSEAEVKKKLEERAKKRGEEEKTTKPARKPPTSITRTTKGANKNEKAVNYRGIERNEYSANARRFLSISRSSSSTDPEVLKILREKPRCRSLIVEENTSGLVSTTNIDEGSYIVELCGFVSLQKDVLNREGAYINDQTFLFEKDGDKIIIDARKCGNVARVVRRSCKPNAELQEIMHGTDLHIMIKAKEYVNKNTEIKIGLEPEWRKNVRPVQECTCKGEELSTCEVDMFFNRKGKMFPYSSNSRRSLPTNGSTPSIKGGRSPIRRAVTEKNTNVSSKKGKKKGTIKLPRHVRKSKGGSTSTASTAEESEREGESEREYESIDNEKEEGVARRGGRRNTMSTSEGKEKDVKKEEKEEEDEQIPVLTPTRSSARMRNDSEVKKEVGETIKEEKNESVAEGSRKKGRKSGIEKEEEVKKEVKEEVATPVMKKEKKPWPKMNYSLPSERNKPSREDRKLQAMCERMEKIEKKKSGVYSTSRGRPPIVTPTGSVKEGKGEKIGSGRGKRKVETEEDSHCTTTSILVLPPPRKRLIEKIEKDTLSPAPSSMSSAPSPIRDDAPFSTPVPLGGKKHLLQRYQEEQAAKAAEAEREEKTTRSSSRTRTNSTPTRGKRMKKEEMKRMKKEDMVEGPIRDDIRRDLGRIAIMKQSFFSIDGTIEERYDISVPSTSMGGPSASTVSPSIPTPATSFTPIEDGKSAKKRSLSIEEYKKRKQAGGTIVGEEKDEKERKEGPPKKSFMPSADASVSLSSLPNMQLPRMGKSVGLDDELARRLYGDPSVQLSLKNKKEEASSSTETPMGKTQPTPKRQSINDRLKNEFALPILSSLSHPLPLSSPSLPSAALSSSTISPVSECGQVTPTTVRPHKNRLSDARALNMEPPGIMRSPCLASVVPSTTRHVHSSPSLASFSQRAASIRSSNK